MTPRQIDQKVDSYIERAMNRLELVGKANKEDIRFLAKLIQEEEHFQQMSEEMKRFNK